MIGYLFLLLLVIIIGLYSHQCIKTKIRREKIRKFMPPGIADNDIVIVRYKGKDLPMKYIEKIELWDNMDREQRRTLSVKITKAIEKGKLKPEQTRPSNAKIFIE